MKPMSAQRGWLAMNEQARGKQMTAARHGATGSGAPHVLATVPA